ncbi:MAG: hypothetical protein DCC58_19450, partial [Chloroflexi bacterium]
SLCSDATSDPDPTVDGGWNNQYVAHAERNRQMIIVRQTFQAKYGQGNALIALFKEFNERARAEGGNTPQLRILTDASGRFFTVVTEATVASLAEWESTFSASLNRPWVGEWFSRMAPLVESGTREFFTVVE